MHDPNLWPYEFPFDFDGRHRWLFERLRVFREDLADLVRRMRPRP